MKDYTDIGLTSNLVSQNSLAVRTTNELIDTELLDKIGPENLSYYQIQNPGRDITAVVSFSKSGGQFTDLQAAINYVNTLNGGEVFIRRGTYSLAGTINLYDNITIEGEDRTTTVLNFNLSGTARIVNAGAGTGDNCVISNLTIGSMSNTNPNLDFRNVNNITIKGVDLRFVGTTFGEECILFGTCQNVTVENCYFTNSGPIQFSNVTYGKIIDNTIGTTNPNEDAIVLSTNCNFINISGNHIDTPTRAGIDGSGTLNNVRIVNNSIINANSSSLSAINLDTGINCIIEANRLQGTGATGINMTSSANGCVITGNAVDGFTTGITVAGTRCSVVGNVCQGNTTSISLSATSSERCVVVGNIARNGITDSGTANTVANNITS